MTERGPSYDPLRRGLHKLLSLLHAELAGEAVMTDEELRLIEDVEAWYFLWKAKRERDALSDAGDVAGAELAEVYAPTLRPDGLVEEFDGRVHEPGGGTMRPVPRQPASGYEWPEIKVPDPASPFGMKDIKVTPLPDWPSNPYGFECPTIPVHPVGSLVEFAGEMYRVIKSGVRELHIEKEKAREGNVDRGDRGDHAAVRGGRHNRGWPAPDVESRPGSSG